MESSAATFEHRLAPRSGGLVSARTAFAAGCGGVFVLGVALRFGTLGVQSYHHDEVITAARVLPGSLGHVLHEVRVSESCPPLYYLLAHWWIGIFGSGEAGLRSLSALFGAATIPVAYLIGKELYSRRAGLITAAIVAVNPMLIWYSQEARAYSLLILLTAVSLYFFLRAMRTGRAADLVLWGVSSALALATHYFAAGIIAIEAVTILFAFGPDLVALGSIALISLIGLALVPLALDQANPHHIGWISSAGSLAARVLESGTSFAAGETGRIIGQKPENGLAALFGGLAGVGIILGLFSRRSALAVGKALAIGAGTIAFAVAAALAGHDYVIARNLLPALVPICAAVGVGFAAASQRWLAVTVAVALCAGTLAFDIKVVNSPDLQRPDWRGLVGRLGPAPQGRALVSWRLGAVPLRYYLEAGDWIHSGDARIAEIDLVGRPGVESHPVSINGFEQTGRFRVGRLTVLRYHAAGPRLVRYGDLRGLPTGFGKNAVILQGTPKLPRTTGEHHL